MLDKVTTDSANGLSSCRERLEIVLQYADETSFNALARRLGLKRSENLYQILKGKNKISPDLALRIYEAYPQFNILWLTTGKGDPFFPPPSGANTSGMSMRMGMSMQAECNVIPLYLDLRFLELGEENTEPDRMLPFPDCLCPEAELATLCRTDALDPRIVRGAYILLHRVEYEDILFGGIYFISTKSYQLCRIVRRAESSDHLLLLTTNPDEYGELVIPRSDIIALYHVCGTFHQMGD